MPSDEQAIQKQGAEARAHGQAEFDNPYLKADALPAVTGEGVEVWQAKVDAWTLGWRVEDAMGS